MGKNSFEPYYIPDVPPDSPGNIEQDGAIQKLIRGQFQSANYVRNQQGFTLNSDGSAEFSKISLGGKIITINQEMSIQAAIDDLNTGAGGTINLLPGVYTMPASTVNLYSRINIIGQSPSGTIIDFNSTAGKFAAAGTSAYSTGTITSITGGVNVTGSGTSWLTNVTALTSQLFIGKRWHLIAAVTSDTTLILAEAYVGDTVAAGSAYRIATPVRDIRIENVQIKNSTGSAFDIDDCRSIFVKNVIFLDNNIGIDATNSSELVGEQLVAASQTSHGYSFTNVGFCDFEGVSALGNGGNGWTLSGCKTIPITTSASSFNTADGINMLNCDDIVLDAVEFAFNGSENIYIETT